MRRAFAFNAVTLRDDDAAILYQGAEAGGASIAAVPERPQSEMIGGEEYETDYPESVQHPGYFGVSGGNEGCE
jgi:hypothetical protein